MKHGYHSSILKQLKQKNTDLLLPKKFQITLVTEKIMVVKFRDSEGIIIIYSIPKVSKIIAVS
jgi:hypothetical protein